MPESRRQPCRIDLWDDFTLVFCPLGRVINHAHAVPAVLMGLDGPFHINFGPGWLRRQFQIVPAGVYHALDCGETQIAVLYLLAPAQAAKITGPGLERNAFERLSLSIRSVAEDGFAPTPAAALVRGALATTQDVRLDPRVEAAVDRLRTQLEDEVSLDAVAEGVRLSPSRLMHLIRDELGTTFRKLRTWERMRAVVQHRAHGDNLTMACLAAGFADSSHFSRSFRQAFGVSASSVLHENAALNIGA